jgi:hypothetical protein
VAFAQEETGVTNFVKLSLSAPSEQHHAGVSHTAPSQHGMIFV